MEENTQVTESTGTEETTTYSAEEVAKLVQQEADRRVSQALKTQKEKFEKQMSEAEKLRTMDESQRKEYEFNQKLEEFEAQKKEFAITQNKLEASKVLAERGLPVQFVDYIVSDNAETMLDNINVFEKMFKASVNDAVSARISNGTPKGATSKQTGITKDEFRKMTISQQSEIYRTNPELYKQLTGI